MAISPRFRPTVGIYPQLNCPSRGHSSGRQRGPHHASPIATIIARGQCNDPHHLSRHRGANQPPPHRGALNRPFIIARNTTMTSTVSATATGLPAPPPPSPRRRAKAPPTPAALRSRIEAAVDKMIAVLDALDAPDEDLEPSVGEANGVLDGESDAGEEPEFDDSDDEPSMGAIEGRDGTRWIGGGVDDLEPSLGFLEHHPNSTICTWGYGYERNNSGDQTKLCIGDREDHEQEHDSREPDDDTEDSLAGIETSPSPTRGQGIRRCADGDQRSWACGASGDLESDNDCDLEDGHDAELVNEDGPQ